MDWLPGARAAVLSRLWGALAREPIPGITDRAVAAGTLSVHFGQRVVTGDRAAAAPFSPPPAGFALCLDGRRYDDPGALLRALDGRSPRFATFAAELDDSVANLALARAARPAPDGGPPTIGRPTPHPAYWEQLVVDGHPLHPGCRTRLGMSAADVRRYAPEHRPLVDLVTVAVPPARWLTTGAGLPPVLTLHPWQAERLGVDGPARPARPLMSLRTLAPLDDPSHHLKTAIDAQLTSAVRTVSEASVRNGPPVTAFLAGIQDGITILREPAAGIVLGDDGRPDRRRAMVLREAPPAGAIPLAALAAPSPADGRPLALEIVAAGYAGDPAAYLADLGRLLRRATDLAGRGVGLEAHGQNLLVTLHRGRPRRLYYRDVGGIRIDARTAKEHGLTLHGDLRTEDPDEPATTVRAAVGVVVGEQVAALARETGAEPEALWRAALPEVHRAPWPVKATTAMRLADDPLRPIWATLR